MATKKVTAVIKLQCPAGAGVAAPAGHCNLITAVTFFVAILFLPILV